MALSSDPKPVAKTKRGRIQSAPAKPLLTGRRLAGNVVADLGFEGGRHMLSNRLPSARGERVVGLRLSEVDGELIRSVVPLKKTLKRLDLSGIRLNSLPSELVAELTSLERLDVSGNQIEDLGPLCRLVTDGGSPGLVELLAHGNRLRRVPATFGPQFEGLRRLNLSQNKIRSCDGFEELKCLQVLILDNNRLESFSDAFYENLRRLEVLHCGENGFTQLSALIGNLRQLRNLDFSGNRLVSVPAELLLLNRLEVLNLSRNRIQRIPTIQLRALRRRPMSVDLSDNELVKFPEQMLSLVRKLDLSRNRIETIPITITKYCSEKDEKLFEIGGNPLENPPLDVCQNGIGAILRYFKTSDEVRVRLSQGLKVMVVGSSDQGKTSLVQTLIDGEPRLTGSERTSLLDVFDHHFEIETAEQHPDLEDGENEEAVSKYVKNIFHLSIWDFSGNERYLIPLHQFIDPPCLILLVFNLKEYEDERFDDLIGRWINWIISKVQRIVLIPVGTHSDQVDFDQRGKICRRASVKIKEFFQERNRFIDREIQKIEGRTHITPSLSERLKHCLSLKRLQTLIHPKVIAVSSRQYEGFDEITTTIRQMVTDVGVFGPVLQSIPSMWEQVEAFVAEKSRSLAVPYMTWKDFEKEAVQRFGMKRVLGKILQYLHNSGKVLRVADAGRRLDEFVFLKPEWLVEVLRSIYRQDLVEGSQLTSEENTLKTIGLTATRFERVKREFINKSVLDRDFLRYILWSLLPPAEGSNRSFSQVLQVLMDRLELGFAVTTKTPTETSSATASVITSTEGGQSSHESLNAAKSLKSSTDPANANENHRHRSKPTPGDGTKAAAGAANYIICSLRKVPRPKSFDEFYESRLRRMPGAVVARFRFPIYLPPGVFERITVRLQSTELNFCIVTHWEGGVYAVHNAKPVHLVMQRNRVDAAREGNAVEVIRLEARSERNELVSAQSSLEDLWSVLLNLLGGVDSMLSSQYSGTYVERRMECPLCYDDSFVGEWQTPKQLQSIASVECSSCHRQVDTIYVIQPKEKRVVDKFLQDIAEQRRKQQDQQNSEDI